MNNSFSIKICSQHCFQPRFLHSHFLNFICTFYAIQTHLFSIKILHRGHFSTFRTFL
jgi:hypothetical protein